MMGRAAQMYWHREWLLRAGVPLFVLAEVDSAGPRLRLRRPARGPHVVSTRSATFLRRRTAVSVILGLAIAVLGGLGGAAAVIVHYVH
jgi:hypothetical protein